MVMCGPVGGVSEPLIVTVAVAVFVLSAWDTAVTLTVAGLGTYGGAVNTPSLETVPIVLLPPAIPLTIQPTLVRDELLTLAVND